MSSVFSFNGAIGRGGFITKTLLSTFVVFFAYFILFAGSLGGAAAGSFSGFGVSMLIAPLVYFAYLWSSVALSIQRCRDAGISPFFVLLYLVFGPFFWLFLCIYQGEKSINTLGQIQSQASV